MKRWVSTLPAWGDQEAQDVVFPRREPKLLAAHGDQPAHEIDGEIAAAEDRPLALLLQAVAQRRAHPGMELVDAEGLGQIVVGAEVEGLDLAALVGAAGEHDDGHRRSLLAQPPDDLEPVEAGEA